MWNIYTCLILNNVLRVRKTLQICQLPEGIRPVRHELLLHKLLQIGIEIKIYRCIKAIYASPINCVRANGRLMGWFPTGSGVRQGESLFPILFAVFINDLAHKLNTAAWGVRQCGWCKTCITYVCRWYCGPHWQQHQMDILSGWCLQSGMKANIKKPQVVHHCNH